MNGSQGTQHGLQNMAAAMENSCVNVESSPPPPPQRSPEQTTVEDSMVQPLDIQEEEVHGRTKIQLYAILAALYLVLFVAALNQTIVATAIPTITAALHSASGYTWIGSAYLLANAATGPIWAKCSDIWGRKPALLTSVTLFAVASAIAALSTTMRMLIAARALQGVAGGGLMQMVAITISDLFSVRHRALYLGLLGVVWAIAGTTGPLIGGAFTQLLSWRWCFWINLPVSGFALVLLFLFLDVHNPRTRLKDGLKAIDWFGTLSILALTLMLLLGLDFGGVTFPWDSPKTICLIVFGTLMLGFFVFNEHHLAKYPLMPLSVFKNSSNVAVFMIAFSHSMVSIGIEYYLPLYFQSVKQALPLHSGVLVLPMMITEAITDVAAGWVIYKTGRYREVIWVGGVLMTVGTALYITFGTNASTAKIVGFQIASGIGVALLFQAPTLAIQNTVTQARTASATATLGFFRNIATSLSIVVGGVVFQNSMASRQSTLAAAGLDDSVLEALSGSQAAANVDVVGLISDEVQRLVVKEVFAWSIRNMFIVYACIAAVTVVSGVFVKGQSLRSEHTETRTGLEKTNGDPA